MRGYFGLGQLSATEKSDILDQHKSLYNGYQTMQPQYSNTQPLTVYDFAGDKDGMVVNNKGEVKKYTNMGINEQVEEQEMCNECGGMMYEGECSECGYKGEMEEETGHLDDIYDEQDLDPTGGFDYIEGPSNDVDTFEGMHKNLYKEDEYEDTDNEDDGFEDIQVGDSEMYEQGGNADDMDVDDVEPAYDFVSNGPMDGGDTYPVNEFDEQCLDCVQEYETMESAWADDEIDEVDVSGSQGIYGDMDPAYDFDSDGPGSAGPYQTSSWSEEVEEQRRKRDDDDDFEEDELEIDFDTFDPRDKSWEEIKVHTGDWDEIDEDLQESFISQKNKVMEMMNRMKVIK
jgi:hypothetical protein